MIVEAFAPGKVILFGEHSVVHNRPAIAVAINRGVCVRLSSRCDSIVSVDVPLIGYHREHCLVDGRLEYSPSCQDKMITDYIYEVIGLFEFESGFDLDVDIQMYLGAGLGSSAATTVSTLKAVSVFVGMDLDLDSIARTAREVEVSVQGAASPIDTSMSTYGGIIYIDDESNLERIDFDMQLPLIVSDCQVTGNTGRLVEMVRQKYVNYPDVMTNILDAMGDVAVLARSALEGGDSVLVADLMNINQGLLDAIGVNTLELSDMVYTARLHGAASSKLTGSGGGGCIIAFCPDNIDVVEEKLSESYPTFKCELSPTGVESRIIGDGD